jgi:hypothetical protein
MKNNKLGVLISNSMKALMEKRTKKKLLRSPKMKISLKMKKISLTMMKSKI